MLEAWEDSCLALVAEDDLAGSQAALAEVAVTVTVKAKEIFAQVDGNTRRARRRARLTVPV